MENKRCHTGSSETTERDHYWLSLKVTMDEEVVHDRPTLSLDRCHGMKAETPAKRRLLTARRKLEKSLVYDSLGVTLVVTFYPIV